MNIEDIKAFLDRASDFMDDYYGGAVGYNEKGVIVREWSTDWDGGMEREDNTVPWEAFTDPDGYDSREDERRKQEQQERARQQAEWAERQRIETERREREALRFLLAKYGTPA